MVGLEYIAEVFRETKIVGIIPVSGRSQTRGNRRLVGPAPV